MWRSRILIGPASLRRGEPVREECDKATWPARAGMHGARGWYHGTSQSGTFMSHLGLANRPRASSIRLDPRAREGLQQQIYAGIRRAILDGVVAPGRGSPPRARWPRTSACPARPPLLALEQLQAEGYLTARRGSGTFVAQELPTTSPRARGTAGAPAPASRRCRAAARPWRRRPRAPGASRARPARSASARPAWTSSPSDLWARLASRRPPLHHGGPARLRRVRRPPRLREAIAEHVRIARGAAATPTRS